jgi:hypothetical protein
MRPGSIKMGVVIGPKRFVLEVVLLDQGTTGTGLAFHRRFVDLLTTAAIEDLDASEARIELRIHPFVRQLGGRRQMRVAGDHEILFLRVGIRGSSPALASARRFEPPQILCIHFHRRRGRDVGAFLGRGHLNSPVLQLGAANSLTHPALQFDLRFDAILVSRYHGVWL